MIANTLDEVIDHLEKIIQDAIRENSCHGYFAALYQKVTICVKDNLGTQYFDDDERMERLDIVFANRYLQAYSDYSAGIPVSHSWKKSFDLLSDNNLIVLQHLLLGMNAHINFDLGIAAAEITDKATIPFLENDFNRINELLGSLVDEIQSDLVKFWPSLHFILKRIGNVDNFFVNFGMGIARDGAWKFANELAENEDSNQRQTLMNQRDLKIADLTRLITDHKLVVRIVFKIIRFSERGNPADKIKALEKEIDLK